MSGLLSRLIGRHAAGELDYETAKRIASAESPQARRTIARRADAQPEILYFLAEDPDVDVRRAVAANESTPPHAGAILACDDDVDVRCNLAERIGRLAPQLDDEARLRIGAVVSGVLDTLARDQISRVRRLLAEQLKQTDNVPVGVIQTLARDRDAGVAGPVLEFSPLLDDEILIEIIHATPETPVLGAISRRRNLGAPVSDAIVGTSDERAIAELLSNHSAQIREETLDRLVDRAECISLWHEPLARRPILSPRSIRRLSEYIADSLLADLEQRRDLDSETAKIVADAVKKRLDDEPTEPPNELPWEPADESIESGEDRADRLYDEGSLDEAAVMDALGTGDRAFVLRALSRLGGIAPEVVSKAVSMGSAKGVTALAWKAGLGMRTAVQLQLRLARVPPPKILQARNGIDYPLGENELQWQIEFFGG